MSSEVNSQGDGGSDSAPATPLPSFQEALSFPSSKSGDQDTNGNSPDHVFVCILCDFECAPASGDDDGTGRRKEDENLPSPPATTLITDTRSSAATGTASAEKIPSSSSSPSPTASAPTSASIPLSLSLGVPSHLTKEATVVLQHMVLTHKLVIADADKIANLSKYLLYWRSKGLVLQALPYYTAQINTSPSPHSSENNTTYSLLSDVLPEDKRVRSELQASELLHLMDQQRQERHDPAFRRKCLFCVKDFEGSRTSYFDHMFTGHGFNIGQPDNLVHVAQFLDILQEKLNERKCIFCEKTFKTHSVLRLHMRKKKHFKIDARNAEYDRFYVVNYMPKDQPSASTHASSPAGSGGRTGNTFTVALPVSGSDANPHHHQQQQQQQRHHHQQQPSRGRGRDRGRRNSRNRNTSASVGNSSNNIENNNMKKTKNTTTTATRDGYLDDSGPIDSTTPTELAAPEEVEEGSGKDNKDDASWDDWNEVLEESTVCLFCVHTALTPQLCFDHMATAHRFDVFEEQRIRGLDEYGCIRLINYVRRRVYEHCCPCCGESHPRGGAALRAHMEKEEHYSIGEDTSFLSDTKYLFPTYENDPLLGVDYSNGVESDTPAPGVGGGGGGGAGGAGAGTGAGAGGGAGGGGGSGDDEATQTVLPVPT
eukprot:TRINITY_DN779_c0_g1_i1.p1 TRINITY_DN779_c0_g1~~TRINITY_DN779_c0_g1_i1.p1  ORF type:complete len:653 (+),score=151.40 TRINITY_DN779_c0_g1_i1:136-2094(+)